MITKFVVLLFFFLFQNHRQIEVASQPSTPFGSIRLNRDLDFAWIIDAKDESIEIEVKKELRSSNDPIWIAVGFSDYGERENADLCVFWADFEGNVLLTVSNHNTFSSTYGNEAKDSKIDDLR